MCALLQVCIYILGPAQKANRYSLVMSSEANPKLVADFSQGELLQTAMIYLVLVSLPFITIVLLAYISMCIARRKQRDLPLDLSESD